MVFFTKIWYGMKSISSVNWMIRQKEWRDIEYFDTGWKERIKQMSAFIKPNKKVLDLGCGKRWLKEYLPSTCLYVPVDYIRRSDDCIVADFNKKEFPRITTDIAFISGCLEYIKDYIWFIGRVTECSEQVILSYCTTNEFPKKNIRKQYHWLNHLSAEKLVDLFISMGFKLEAEAKTNDKNHLFFFTK